jgi:hypothetical protein
MFPKSRRISVKGFLDREGCTAVLFNSGADPVWGLRSRVYPGLIFMVAQRVLLHVFRILGVFDKYFVVFLFLKIVIRRD